MNKPRVLIFSLAYFPFVGGAEVAVKELTDRLANQFEFEIISANVRNFWSKYFYPVWAYRRALRLHRQRKFNLVWAIMANQAGMAAARFKKKFPDVPFLLTLQEGDDLNSLAYRTRLLLPRLFGVFRRADQIQAISNYLAKWARRLGATCPIEVIPNGVDLEKFSLSPKTYHLKPNPVLITTSRLVEKNGVGDLVEALRYLPENVSLQILGIGELEKELKLKAKSLKLEARVQFLGQIESSRIAEYLSQADIFIRPSLSEGLGNSFLEAMAAGLPTVGTSVGGIPDFLKEGETGWLCRVHDPESIAEKVKFILDPANQQAVQEVAGRGRDLARGNYDWAAIANQLKDVFNQLI